ncbi:MAG: TlpA family protein disulfide reductase [Gammaproteobacteria bacterium]|nr:TlpA family protein disulfide reductase [Gammaproteobacteria bacterium]
MNLRSTAAVALLSLASAAAGFGLYRWWDARTPELAPAIQLTDLDGRPRALSEWRDRLLLVNFWATWCAPCLKEIPLLVEAQKEYAARGFQVIGPAMDNPDAVRAGVQRLGIPYPVMAGDAEIAQAMDALGDTLQALPFSVLIGHDGRILLRRSGEFTRAELIELIERHLGS